MHYMICGSAVYCYHDLFGQGVIFHPIHVYYHCVLYTPAVTNMNSGLLLMSLLFELPCQLYI